MRKLQSRERNEKFNENVISNKHIFKTWASNNKRRQVQKETKTNHVSWWKVKFNAYIYISMYEPLIVKYVHVFACIFIYLTTSPIIFIYIVVFRLYIPLCVCISGVGLTWYACLRIQYLPLYIGIQITNCIIFFPLHMLYWLLIWLWTSPNYFASRCIVFINVLICTHCQYIYTGPTSVLKSACMCVRACEFAVVMHSCWTAVPLKAFVRKPQICLFSSRDGFQQQLLHYRFEINNNI